MLIKRLFNSRITDCETVIYKKGDKSYHNLRHGLRGKGLWEWGASLSARDFPVINDEPIVLDGNNYGLRYIKDGKDSEGNDSYVITVEENNYVKDVLLLWDPRLLGINEIEYNLSGQAEVLGKGKVGKVRKDNKTSIEAPIIEITGDMTLTWIGKATDKTYTGSTTYDYKTGEWKFKYPVEIDTKE